jgi:hypothetical protein
VCVYRQYSRYGIVDEKLFNMLKVVIIFKKVEICHKSYTWILS